MNTLDPKDAPQCRAHNRQGTRCKRRPVPGALVCKLHGGAAPQVIRNARQRLLEAADPAAAALVELLKSDDENVRLRAITTLLDRAGHAPGVKVGQLEDDTAVNEEIERLLTTHRDQETA